MGSLPEDPEITICIPSKDNLDCLSACLSSLADTVSGHPVDLLVGDTGSAPDTWEFYEAAKIPTVKISGPFNFSRACNKMALQAKGKNILFLNNDTQAIDGNWIHRLLSIKDDRVVGALLLFPGNRAVQHGGIKFFKVEGDAARSFPYSPTHIGYQCHMNMVSPREISGAVAVTGAFMYTPKDLFLKLGGFDLRYRDDFQDVDYCFEARNAGVPVVCDSKIVFFHRMCASRPNYLDTHFWKSDHRLFFHRWKEEIRLWKENFPLVFGGKKRRVDMKKILVVDDYVPSWTTLSPRTYSMITNLAKLGYLVTLFPTANAAPSARLEDGPMLENLQMQGIEVATWTNFQGLAEERSGEFDIVMIARPHNFKMCHEIARRHFPKAKFIYDTEALFFLREERQAQVHGMGGSHSYASFVAESEASRVSDCVIAVSEEEKEVLQDRLKCPKEKIRTWGFSIPLNITPNDFESRSNLLFIGGSISPAMPNGDAVKHFVEKIFPKVRQRVALQLVMVGSSIDESMKYPEQSYVLTRGFVQDTWDTYNESRVFIVPHRYAAGISFKLCETMAHGVPAVVTRLIANQLGITDGVQALVADSDDEFAEKTARLYQDKGTWMRIRENGIAFMNQKYNPVKALQALKQIIEGVSR